MKKNNFLKLKPMLLEEVSKSFNDKDYIFELKFDGIRAMIYIKEGDIIVRSRNGIILNDIYPELESIKDITNEECIFDGEIVLLDNGKPTFIKVMERFKLKNKNKIAFMKEKNPVTFVVFDILFKNKDLTCIPLIDRKEILEGFKDSDIFVKSKYIEANGKDLFNIVKKNKLEGIVAKRKDSKYYYGVRTSNWVKIKNWISEDFFVCGYELTKGQTVINIILGEKTIDGFYYVGKVIMGEKNSLYKKIINLKKVKNYLRNYDNKGSYLVSPKYKLKINYIERTKDNMLREAVIKK